MFSFRKNKSSDPPRRHKMGQGSDRRERVSEAELEQNYTFRRNRTLTGSTSSNVTSAVEHIGDLQSARTQAHHLALKRRKIASILGIVLICTACLAVLLYNFTAQPSVSSSDALSLESSRYEYAINDYLTIHPLERLRFTLNESRLTDYLRQTVPEVIAANQEGFKQLGVTEFSLTMRHPIASWIINGKQYFVDEEGISFERNYYPTPVVNVIDQSGVQQATGAAIASSRFLTFVGRVVAETRSAGFSVEQAIIPVGTTRQLEVKLQGRAYLVKLSLDRGPAEQIEDMKNAIAFFDVHHLTPQYVDVRVAGKAFYR